MLRYKKPGVDKDAAKRWANKIKESDWAKLTGMSKKKVTTQPLSIEQAKAHLQGDPNGSPKGPVRATQQKWKCDKNGKNCEWKNYHFLNVTDVSGTSMITDESLNGIKKSYPIDGTIGKNKFRLVDFWTLEIK